MKPLAAVIIDDEPPARMRVRQLIAGDDEIRVVAEAADGAAALTAIRHHKPDLVFLDVQMPELTGVELLSSLPAGERPAVIFITAYDEFALKAFELHAMDYLLKPFTDVRFLAALDRVKARLRRLDLAAMQAQLERVLADLAQARAASSAPPAAIAPERAPLGKQDRLTVRVSGELLFIRFADLRWVEGAGDYLRLHTRSGTPLIRETFKELLQRLDPARFVRIHKSAVINSSFVAKIRPAASGDYEVELDDGTTLTVSRVFRQNLGEVHGLAWSRASG